MISIENQYISRSDINKAIEEFKRIRPDDMRQELIFGAKQKIMDVDILFVGYLLLFKTQLPDLRITLDLSAHGADERVKYKLKQYAVYGYLLTGASVFTVLLSAPAESIEFKGSRRRSFGKDEFVLSDSFMLLLLVNKDDNLFADLFERPLSELTTQPLEHGVDGVEWNGENEPYYKDCLAHLRKMAVPGDKRKCIIDLARLAFFNCLQETKILPLYADEPRRVRKITREGVRVSRVQSPEKIDEYYRAIEPVFDELRGKPLIYQFVFSSLTASDVLPREIDNDNIGSAPGAVRSLWQFTENLVRSLIELAKNLRDHTGTGCGVITASVIKTSENGADEGNTDPGNLISKVVESGKIKAGAFLDIHVSDLGDRGIIPTFLYESGLLLERSPGNDKLTRLIRDDIAKLEDKAFELKHLFTADQPVRLYQQSKRAIAHIGLLTLSKLIEKNKGVLKVETRDGEGARQMALIPNESQGFSDIRHGTFFTIILPLEEDRPYASFLPGSLQLPAEPSLSDLRGIETLFSFHQIHTDEETATVQPQANDGTSAIPADKRLLLTHRFRKPRVENREDEYALFTDLRTKLDPYIAIAHGIDNIIVHLDLEGVIIDASSLLRLAGRWETYFPKSMLLIGNIPNSQYHELVEINRILTGDSGNSTNIGFWNEYSPLLVFSYACDHSGKRFYFTDILLGRTWADFCFHNRMVGHNHFNSTSILAGDPASTYFDTGDGATTHVSRSAYSFSAALPPFDLILTGQENATMFENNASMLLMNEIEINRKITPSPDLISRIKQFAGYKVTHSHYRIGSKLHITDFYYARRMFQNSFFASRFAFILAKEIIGTLEMMPKPDQTYIREKGLTFIGYGLYSELLVSLLEKFVGNNSMIGRNMVNHDLVSDEADNVRFRSGEIHKSIIIVVPIASTFSTAIKIEERLRSLHKDSEVRQPHYNVLHITGSPESTKLSKPEEDFGWKEKDPVKKAITLEAFFAQSGQTRIQRYFIALPTDWQAIDSCTCCFPETPAGEEDLLKEKPLFETDRTSVTPTVIFDYPRGRVSDPQEDIVGVSVLNADMIRYGEYAPDNSHFIYTFDTEEFLEANEPAVREWLKVVKKDRKFSETFPDRAHTVIVASCHYSNIAFIDLVNEILFGSSATVIHYDPANEHFQNFDLIHGAEVRRADRIIFVDDNLKSGNTFARVRDFVQHIRGRAKKAINACIILIDQSERFTHEWMCDDLQGNGKIYSFANLNLYASMPLSNLARVAQENKSIAGLMNDSFLDSLKAYFLRQAIRLNYKWTDDIPKAENSKNRNRHLSMIEATHLIYQYFSPDNRVLDAGISFKEFVDSLRTVPMKTRIMANPDWEEILGLSPLDVAILKALTQQPFTQYEPLHKCTFRWVIELLDRHLKTIEGEIEMDRFELQSYYGLKLLLRRAVLMNSNYLISKRVFKFLGLLYGIFGIPALQRRTGDLYKAQKAEIPPHDVNVKEKKAAIDEEEKAVMDSIRGFPIFFGGQVKQLLSKNQVRSIKLERLLANLSVDDRNVPHNQLILILKAENAIILQRCYEWLKQQWKQLYQPPGDDVRWKDTQRIKEFMGSAAIETHQYMRSLRLFMGATRQPRPEENSRLLTYLWIRNYLEVDLRIDTLSLTERSRRLFSKLREIAESPVTSSTGIFLAIPNGKNDSDLVYDRNEQNAEQIDSSGWRSEENKYLQELLFGSSPDGSEKYYTTLVDLRRNDHRIWKDRQYSAGNQKIQHLSGQFPSKAINGLIVMRLSKGAPGKEGKALGILGIYFRTEERDQPTDSNIIRYLLLLRESLGDFVERHYHNNEYRDWREAEYTKRLALLTGHGKEMLKELSARGDLYKNIALYQEAMQWIVLFRGKMKDNSSRDDIRGKFDMAYNVGGRKAIDEDYFKALEQMANDIYKFEEIETTVKCDVQRMPRPVDFSFAFHPQILNVICFELFVNAKKNRWHFLKGDDAIEGETFRQRILRSRMDMAMTAYDVGRGQPLKIPLISEENKKISYHENILDIDVSLEKLDDENWMKISITNIGPLVPEETIDRMNFPTQDVKAKDITSGTSLLKELIVEFLRGEIEFSSKQVCKDTDLAEFTVTIMLKEMNEDETQDTLD